MLLDVLYVVAGAVVLMLAADRLVSSSGDLASRLGVSPVVVGAIVIGFGSSLPEMLVSLAALDQPNGLDHTSPGQRPGIRDEPERWPCKGVPLGMVFYVVSESGRSRLRPYFS